MTRPSVPAVRVNRKAADRLASGHPWIFSSDVVERGGAAPGDAVTVIDPRGRPLGTAHYSSTSQICLRLLSGRVEPIDRAFLARRLEAAAEHRRRLVTDSDAYRLVYGEADGLPGLVVDHYAGYLVVQALDQGMDRATPEIVACLNELLTPLGIVARNDASVRAKENLKLETTVLAGVVPERVKIHMHGLELEADLMHGQKTGVYLDQRENYLAAARYARGCALDCFTSAGGFALHLAAEVRIGRGRRQFGRRAAPGRGQPGRQPPAEHPVPRGQRLRPAGGLCGGWAEVLDHRPRSARLRQVSLGSGGRPARL